MLWSPSLLLCRHGDGRVVLETVGQSLDCCLGSADGTVGDYHDQRCTDAPVLRALADAGDGVQHPAVAVASDLAAAVSVPGVAESARLVEASGSSEAITIRARRTVVLQR
jgi:hypothetical protein